jgi:CRP-like cAMP-binding protein
MSNSIRAATKIPKDRHVHPTHEVGPDPAHPTDILRKAGHYKLADRAVKAGCDLFRLGERGEAIYSLLSGWVALYNLMEDGRRQILQFALPGTILAFVPKQGAVMNYSAQALTDVVVTVVPHKDLGPLARECPEIGIQLASLISQDRSLAYDQLSSVGRHSGRERVAHLLLELFIRSRMRWPGHRSEEMHLPLTQEHIGDATGLTGVHVNRILRDLRKQRILEFHYRRLRILNPDKLVDVAGIDPHVAMSWIVDETSSERKNGTLPMGALADASRRRDLERASRSVAPPSARILPERIPAA